MVGRWHGDRKIRPILALHGWQDNLGTWDRLIPLLPPHVGILCIDLPGHGRSSKYPIGATYHAIDYVEIIARVAKEYGWKKVSLMGHSMGAIVAFVYTALYPNMVDLLIQIDLVKSVNYTVNKHINKIFVQAERSLLENDRLENSSLTEPPSFLYQQLEDVLHQGSGKSVKKENCQYLLDRSIEKSQMYPDKYYFSRDGRIKYCVEMSGEHGLALEMAKRIKNIPYLLIRSDSITYMASTDEEVLDVLRTNCSHFEDYTVYNSTHHLHLNDAEKVAALLNPFILKHFAVHLDCRRSAVKDRSFGAPKIKSQL